MEFDSFIGRRLPEKLKLKFIFTLSGQTESPEVNKAVLEESKECGDILIGDFSDSYKNLVFKTLWLIEWAANRLNTLVIRLFNNLILYTRIKGFLINKNECLYCTFLINKHYSLHLILNTFTI